MRDVMTLRYEDLWEGLVWVQKGKGGGIGWLQSSARKTAAKKLYSWTYVCRR